MLQWRRYEIRGLVQGVGFRPYVCKMASTNGIKGTIQNTTEGVIVEIEGSVEESDRFLQDLCSGLPPLCKIDGIILFEKKEISQYQYLNFYIKESEYIGRRDALITPDANVCDDCLAELFDPSNRRKKYPFINCTNCGPRFSITHDLPYDRSNTTMSKFNMCKECSDEYHDILDRRFHAQPIACWNCGPSLHLMSNEGKCIKTIDPIVEAVELLKQGAIIAVKGVGGYHIMADPANCEAIDKLRTRKRRPERPLALISESLGDVSHFAKFDKKEGELLCSVARPIVILKKQLPEIFSDKIAPGQDSFGVVLAYTPLHHLLLRDNFLALVATSANVTSEPIVFEDDAVVSQLSNIVDYVLSHNRPIYSRVDDSIVQIVKLGESSQSIMIRRARGYTPTPLRIQNNMVPLLALGAELKSTISVTKGSSIFLSQHIGDLKNFKNYEYFMELSERMPRMLGVKPEVLACDLHPEMLSTRFAYESINLPVFQIQHHHAHMASCMVENAVQDKTIGVTFDGAGYGDDRTIWGGEFLIGDFLSFERRAHLRAMPLPGLDVAVKEPYRIAVGLLSQIIDFDEINVLPIDMIQKLDSSELNFVLTMLRCQINSPMTSSAGRLFDGVAALLGIRSKVSYEGQAAMELESLASLESSVNIQQPFTYDIEMNNGAYELDFRPMIRQIVSDLVERKSSISSLSRRFHITLANAVCRTCVLLRLESGINVVALSGGVFLNKYLLAECHSLLSNEGFCILLHSQVPTNDGGISVGQAVIANARYFSGNF